jgi:hypothetical protein
MPYPGLRSFRREESDLFFGREDCITTMVDRLAANRFLAVLGSSGTGKSSVVKTGLLDALDLGTMTQAGSNWRVVLLRPGSTPLANLARGLIEAEASDGTADDADVDLLRAFLLRGPRAVAEWCRDGHLPAGQNLLLLVDQFEELFRYRDYAGREEAEAFAALLIESARATELPIYVTITMRSEYLGACALVEGLAEAISASLFLTPRMSREQCRAAIVGPAAVCGVAIDKALANRLLNDLAAFAPWDERSGGDQLDRLGRRADQLPLLQYCLNRMWVTARNARADGAVRLTQADYERIGGLAGALSAHADEILGALGAERLPIAEAAFRALTEGSTVTDAVRRPTRLRDLVEICNGDEAGVRAVVDAFRASGCNFLAPELDPSHPKPLDDDAVIDISHESLIRQWKRLSDWLDKEARAGRQWRRLLDRRDSGEPMHGTELANVVAWLEEERPNAAWAARHGGNFAGVTAFIEESERKRRRFAPLIVPVVGTAISSISTLLAGGVWSSVFGTAVPSSAWYVILAIYSQTTPTTLAFAIWLYGGVTARRALLAGAIIFALEFASGAVVLSTSAALAVPPQFALHVWGIVFLAPVALTVMAIFAPAFRSLAVWLVLTVLLVILLLPPVWLYHSKIISDPQLNALIGAAGFMWNAAIGLQLRRGAESLKFSARTRYRLAPIVLPLFGLIVLAGSLVSVVIVTVVAHCAQGDCSAAIAPPWTWLADVGTTAVATAIALGFGLWRYSGVAARRSILIACTMFALSFATGAGLIAILTSRGTSVIHATHWWYATFYPVCTLAAIATFEPLYRRASVWLPGVALFTLPYGLLIGLRDVSLISAPNSIVVLLVYVIRFSWFAALACQLRSPQAPAFRPRSRAQPPAIPPGVAAAPPARA